MEVRQVVSRSCFPPNGSWRGMSKKIVSPACLVRQVPVSRPIGWAFLRAPGHRCPSLGAPRQRLCLALKVRCLWNPVILPPCSSLISSAFRQWSPPRRPGRCS